MKEMSTEALVVEKRATEAALVGLRRAGGNDYFAGLIAARYKSELRQIVAELARRASTELAEVQAGGDPTREYEAE
jgi:hypothetical protein